jgi:hypothetical protein
VYYVTRRSAVDKEAEEIDKDRQEKKETGATMSKEKDGTTKVSANAVTKKQKTQ